MTDDKKKKHDDNDREKLSDEEMEDVDGGLVTLAAFAISNAAKQTDEELKAKITGAKDHNSSRSNKG